MFELHQFNPPLNLSISHWLATSQMIQNLDHYISVFHRNRLYFSSHIFVQEENKTHLNNFT